MNNLEPVTITTVWRSAHECTICKEPIVVNVGDLVCGIVTSTQEVKVGEDKETKSDFICHQCAYNKIEL